MTLETAEVLDQAEISVGRKREEDARRNEEWGAVGAEWQVLTKEERELA